MWVTKICDPKLGALNSSWFPTKSTVIKNISIELSKVLQRAKWLTTKMAKISQTDRIFGNAAAHLYISTADDGCRLHMLMFGTDGRTVVGRNLSTAFSRVCSGRSIRTPMSFARLKNVAMALVWFTSQTPLFVASLVWWRNSGTSP